MNSHSLQEFFNFDEVADNTLGLMRHLLGAKTYYIGHTTEEEFGVIRSVSNGECAVEEGIVLGIQDSY